MGPFIRVCDSLNERHERQPRKMPNSTKRRTTRKQNKSHPSLRACIQNPTAECCPNDRGCLTCASAASAEKLVSTSWPVSESLVKARRGRRCSWRWAFSASLEIPCDERDETRGGEDDLSGAVNNDAEHDGQPGAKRLPAASKPPI